MEFKFTVEAKLMGPIELQIKKYMWTQFLQIIVNLYITKYIYYSIYNYKTKFKGIV